MILQALFGVERSGVDPVHGDPAFQQLFQPAHVVLVRVGDHNAVQPGHAVGFQHALELVVAVLGAGVHQKALVVQEKQRRVRLAHVDEQGLHLLLRPRARARKQQQNHQHKRQKTMISPHFQSPPASIISCRAILLKGARL